MYGIHGHEQKHLDLNQLGIVDDWQVMAVGEGWERDRRVLVCATQEPEVSPVGPSPFSADFIASVLAKLPEEEGEAAVPSSQPLQQGHSQFLDSLLGHPTSSEPAILPAPGQFSLVGRIAQPAIAADGGGNAGDIAAAAPDEGSKGVKPAELRAAPVEDGDAERRDQMQTEVKAQMLR